jgi:hypothetical protein
MIFTLTTAAVKEIYTEYQISKKEIVDLQSEVKNLKDENQLLKEQISLILSRLDKIE